MKKIILSLLSIFMTVGVVSGAAYALFSDTVEVKGITFATGNADLKVWDGDSWENSWADSSLDFTGMYPGYGGNSIHDATSVHKVFHLKNFSTSDIGLNVFAKLSNYTVNPSGSWGALRDKVFVIMTLDNDLSVHTGWHSLNDWYTTGYSLPGNPLAHNTQEKYRFYVKVDSTAGNEISDKALEDVQFDFTGEQAI